MSKRHRKTKLFSDNDFGGSEHGSSYSYGSSNDSGRSEFGSAPRDLDFDDLDFGGSNFGDSGDSFTMRPAKRMKGKHRRGGAQKRAYYDL